VTGVDRYTAALAELREYHETGSTRSLQEAMVNATLAVAAATALQAVLPLVGGDAAEINEWVKAVLPSLRDVTLRASEAKVEADRLRDLLGDVITEFEVCGSSSQASATVGLDYLNRVREAAGLYPIFVPNATAAARPEWWPPQPGDLIDTGAGRRWMAMRGSKAACVIAEVGNESSTAIDPEVFAAKVDNIVDAYLIARAGMRYFAEVPF
jgi:hypothetical protein